MLFSFMLMEHNFYAARQKEKCNQECLAHAASGTPISEKLEILSIYRYRDMSSPLRACDTFMAVCVVFYDLSGGARKVVIKKKNLHGWLFNVCDIYFFRCTFKYEIRKKNAHFIGTYRFYWKTEITQHRAGCSREGLAEPGVMQNRAIISPNARQACG